MKRFAASSGAILTGARYSSTTVEQPKQNGSSSLPPRRIVECPRDAMQGLRQFVPTEDKVRYMNALLRCGFYALDFGSFVSEKAIPQMKDSEQVLAQLDLDPAVTKTLLSVVVCNIQGCITALKYPQIKMMGFPLSCSEQFQRQNTRKNIATALKEVEKMAKMTAESNAARRKENPNSVDQNFLLYISMAYGNPYGEAHSLDTVINMVKHAKACGVQKVSLADTVGAADADSVYQYHARLKELFPEMEFGAHLHTGMLETTAMSEAVAQSKADWIDCALGGMGGCPYAASSLVGNIATESVLEALEKHNIPHSIDHAQLAECQLIKQNIFGVAVKEIMLSRVLHDEKHFTQLCMSHFNQYETSGTGYLDYDSFHKSMIAVFGELGVRDVNEERVKRAFDKVDVLHRGKITMDTYMLGARRLMQKRLKLMEAGLA